jgi:cytochrome c553
MKEQMNGLTGPEIEALATYFARQQIDPDPLTDRAAVARGMVIYHGGGRRNEPGACVSCHGPYARGGQMLPRLAGQHASYLERQMHAFVARTRPSGPPGMHSAVSKLTLAQMRDTALYLASME